MSGSSSKIFTATTGFVACQGYIVVSRNQAQVSTLLSLINLSSFSAMKMGRVCRARVCSNYFLVDLSIKQYQKILRSFSIFARI